MAQSARRSSKKGSSPAALRNLELVGLGVELELWIDNAPATHSFGKLPSRLAQFVKDTPLPVLRTLAGAEYHDRVKRLKHRSNNKSSQDHRQSVVASELADLKTKLDAALQDVVSLEAHCAQLEAYVAFVKTKHIADEADAAHDLFGRAWTTSQLGHQFFKGPQRRRRPSVTVDDGAPRKKRRAAPRKNSCKN